MNKDELKAKFTEVFNIKSILGFLVLILVFVAAGLVEGWAVGMDFNYVYTSEYWTTVLYRTGLKYLSSLGTGMIVISFFAISKKTKAERENCKKLLKAKNKNFAKFIENEDRLSKIDTWKQHISKKISKIGRKLEVCKRVKRKEKLNAKLEELKLQLTDEWIDANIDDLIIRYPRRMEVNFIAVDSIDIQSNASLDPNVEGRMHKNSLRGILGGLIFSVVLTLVTATDLEKESAALLIGLLIDFGTILTAILMSVVRTVRQCDTDILGNIYVKEQIMRKFIRQEYGLDDEDVDTLMKKVYVDTEKKNLGMNLALQIQNGNIVLKDKKLLDTNSGDIIGEKVENSSEKG